MTGLERNAVYERNLSPLFQIAFLVFFDMQSGYGGKHLRRDGCFGLDYAVGNQKRKGGEEMNQLFQNSVFFGVLISLQIHSYQRL